MSNMCSYSVLMQSFYSLLTPNTQEHSLRVADYMKVLAKRMQLNSDIAFVIGLYHDIGKIYIPEWILEKKGALSDIERPVVDLHSYWGYQLMAGANIDRLVTVPILYHHGTDKPKLEKCPEMNEMEQSFCLLLSVTDCFDAITHKRSYHKAKSPDDAFKILGSIGVCDNTIIHFLQDEYKKGNIII